MIQAQTDRVLRPTSFTADAELLEAIEREMTARKSHNRSEVIRALIAEGVHRANRMRTKGTSPELGSK